MRCILIGFGLCVLISSVYSTPIGATLPKSNLYSLENGNLKAGYSITGNNNDAKTTKGGGGVALNTNYAASVSIGKKANGASNTQTSSTTGINAAVQLPVADQKLLGQLGKKGHV